jgi:hypothetical protein
MTLIARIFGAESSVARVVHAPSAAFSVQHPAVRTAAFPPQGRGKIR